MDNDNRAKFHLAYIKGDKGKIKHILHQKLPCSLIKFCSGCYSKTKDSSEVNYCLEALRSQQIWLSSPHYFNDPFDCAVKIDYKAILRQDANDFCTPIFGKKTKELLNSPNANNILELKAEKISNELKENNEKVTNNIFVSCFSEKSNLSSLLMWGHYANCHQGFCLEYDFREMNHKIPEGIIPILYNNKFQNDIKGESDVECRTFCLATAFTKSTEWLYEKEWRILKIEEAQAGKPGYLLPFIKPSKIYLGCKAEPRLKNDLFEICNSQKIDLFEMKMKQGAFELSYRRCKEKS